VKAGAKGQFKGEAKPLTGGDGGGAGGGGDADAGALEGSRLRRGGGAEAAGKDGGGGDALAVVLVKVLGFDFAVGVEQEKAGMGDAFGEAVLDVLVADFEGVDDFGIGVGEERVLDLAAISEVGQGGGLIVAERGDAVAELADGLGMVAEFDQLGFAEGAPVGGAGEEDPKALWTAEGGEVAGLAGLIDGIDGRGLGADGRAETFGERGFFSLPVERKKRREENCPG